MIASIDVNLIHSGRFTLSNCREMGLSQGDDGTGGVLHFLVRGCWEGEHVGWLLNMPTWQIWDLLHAYYNILLKTKLIGVCWLCFEHILSWTAIHDDLICRGLLQDKYWTCLKYFFWGSIRPNRIGGGLAWTHCAIKSVEGSMRLSLCLSTNNAFLFINL